MVREGIFFERLSGLDAAFLSAETGGVHMHIGAMMRFGKCELCHDDGGVDFDALRLRAIDMIEGDLRLRQRLAWAPGLKHPYWVDDPNFRLSYHVRHTSLPRPGDEGQLKRLVGRILSQRLDRDKPLWEMWIVEGLHDGGFAIIFKFHHCVLDGMAAVSLLARVVAGVRGSGEVPTARPGPSGRELLEFEARHRGRSLTEMGQGLRDMASDPQPQTNKDMAELFSGARAFAEVLLNRSPRTRLNPQHLSGHRRFETLSVPFVGIRRIKKEHKTTVNDVVLAIVTEGLRRYLTRSGVDPASLKPFRALVPASTRTRAQRRSGKMGNDVAMMMAELPIDEEDPIEQLHQIHETTEFLKTESHELDSTKWLTQLDDRLGLGLMGSAFRWGSKLRPFNVLVTNVPGPPIPVKAFGAPLTAIYGAVPLTDQQGLGITLFSYAGQLHFGLQADLDALDDLTYLADDLRAAHDALCGEPEAPKVSKKAARS